MPVPLSCSRAITSSTRTDRTSHFVLGGNGRSGSPRYVPPLSGGRPSGDGLSTGGHWMHHVKRLGVVFATAGLAATSLWVGVVGVGANTIDPPGCENNGINLTIGRSPAIVHTGQTITYTVSVSNDDPTGTLKFCNVTG